MPRRRSLRESLRQALSPNPQNLHLPERSLLPRRVVVVGVGSRLRSDDAAGLEIADRLASLALPDVLTLLGDTAPENVTGEIRRFAPTHVVFADAADLGEAPGAVQVLESSEIDGMTSSTHTLPLHVIADYLSRETGCCVLFLAVQPKVLEFGETISAEVAAAVEEAVTAIAAVLS